MVHLLDHEFAMVKLIFCTKALVRVSQNINSEQDGYAPQQTKTNGTMRLEVVITMSEVAQLTTLPSIEICLLVMSSIGISFRNFVIPIGLKMS